MLYLKDLPYFYCQKVLPAVFDDSLSYYEQLCVMRNKINEIIDVVGDAATIQALKEALAMVEEEIENLRKYVDAQDEAEQIRADKYSDARNLELEQKLLNIIYRVTTGDVLVKSQVDGRKKQHLQFELDKTYDYLRPFAVTADEFDYLEITAQEIEVIQSTEGTSATAYVLDLLFGCALMGFPGYAAKLEDYALKHPSVASEYRMMVFIQRALGNIN